MIGDICTATSKVAAPTNTPDITAATTISSGRIQGL
jgi:hypothetical protein